jgi:hypothetical protein
MGFYKSKKIGFELDFGDAIFEKDVQAVCFFVNFILKTKILEL